MPTQTLLQAANETLLNIGELEVADFANPVGRKVRMATRTALRAVTKLHNWSYLQAETPMLSWGADGQPQLPQVLDVYTVVCRTTVLRSVAIDRLYEYARQSPAVASPVYFSLQGLDRLFLYPVAPVVDRPFITARVLLEPIMPTLATESYTLPDDVHELVQLYAQMLMHRNHTTDTASMQACQQEFELMLHMTRTRDTSQTVGSMR